MLLIAAGFPNSLVDQAQKIYLFIQLWFISPIDKLAKKEWEEKNKRKVEAVKVIERQYNHTKLN